MKVKRAIVTKDFLIDALKGKLPPATLLTPFPEDANITAVTPSIFGDKLDIIIFSESFPEVDLSVTDDIPILDIVLKASY